MRDLRGRQIGLAVGLAAGLHIAAAAVVLRAPDGGSPGGMGPGVGGIGITLGGSGPAGGAGVAAGSPELAGPLVENTAMPDAVPTETAPEPVTATAVPVAQPDRQLTQAETIPPETPITTSPPVAVTPPETARAVEATPPEPAATEPVTLAAIPTEMVDATPPTRITPAIPANEVTATPEETILMAPRPTVKPPVPENLPEPEPEKPEPQKVRREEPRQPREARPEPPAAIPEKTKERKLASRPPGSENAGPGANGALASKGAWGAGGAGNAAAGGSGGAASPSGGGGGGASAGSAAAHKSFLVEVASWLNRHKRYPRRARRRGDEGTGVLRFVMNAEGQVLSANLVESSGSGALDDEILDMVERAEPLPAIPAALGADTLTITVPVGFRLR